jgi:hypothetical protein
LSKNVEILVPYNAYSSGTLMCLGANKIWMGACAALSPIDITYTFENDDGTYDYENEDKEDIPLICIDNFVKFTKYCKDKIEIDPESDERIDTKIEEFLLQTFIDRMGVIKIAGYFRERDSTRLYAYSLLKSYMFPENDKNELIDSICKSLVYDFPSHRFEIDYYIAANMLGLNVEKMPIALSCITRRLIDELTTASEENIICKNLDDENKMPYIKYYSGAANDGKRTRNKPGNP